MALVSLLISTPVRLTGIKATARILWPVPACRSDCVAYTISVRRTWGTWAAEWKGRAACKILYSEDLDLTFELKSNNITSFILKGKQPNPDFLTSCQAPLQVCLGAVGEAVLLVGHGKSESLLIVGFPCYFCKLRNLKNAFLIWMCKAPRALPFSRNKGLVGPFHLERKGHQFCFSIHPHSRGGRCKDRPGRLLTSRRQVAGGAQAQPSFAFYLFAHSASLSLR